MMRAAFPALVATGALFVALSSSDLPLRVATHVGAGGHADGFMPREVYVAITIGMVVLLPLMVALSARLASRLPSQRVNLPNRHYWLAPERKAATVRDLSARLQVFAAGLVVFLCYVHVLVIEANRAAAGQLAPSALYAGLAAFVLGTALWIAEFYARFSRVPD